jgi:hypothetical protein
MGSEKYGQNEKRAVARNITGARNFPNEINEEMRAKRKYGQHPLCPKYFQRFQRDKYGQTSPPKGGGYRCPYSPKGEAEQKDQTFRFGCLWKGTS